MSMDLKQTSANLNRNVYFDRSKKILFPIKGYTAVVDAKLSSHFYTAEHLQKVANICFNSCVNDFGSPNFSLEESTCLNLCKSEIIPFIKEATPLQDKNFKN